MTNWFIADTHFGSERHLELCRRPFNSVKEMDDTMITNWNALIAPDDTVYHLGDFGNYDVLPHLNGQIHLLVGNYERDEEITSDILLKRRLFASFSRSISRLITLSNGQAIELVHEPSNRQTDKMYLFGHIHAAQQVKPNGLNVGVDCHHFLPISEKDVLFYLNAIKYHYDNEVFGTF